MQAKRKPLLIVVIAIAAVGALLLPFMYVSYAQGSWFPTAGQGPYGSGSVGMMGGWSYVSAGYLGSTIWTPPTKVSNDSLAFNGSSIKILVLMGSMSGGQSMYSFVIDNLTNPTLVFPAGARVTMVAVNVDTDAYHGLTISRLAPPYGYNVMVGMMGSTTSTMMLPPSGSVFAAQQITFTVNGDAYYFCPVPGHAQLGMSGLIRQG